MLIKIAKTLGLSDWTLLTKEIDGGNTMTLIVLVGPTAVGKTSVAIRLAQTLSCPIINCDSRQIYRGMDIGTAAPTPQEMAQAEHYFVRQLHLGEEYSAARYEQDVLQLMQKLSATHTYAILSGGSMMYVDAVCQGIDDIPTVDAQVRSRLHERYEQEGLQPLLAELLETESFALRFTTVLGTTLTFFMCHFSFLLTLKGF